MEPDTFIIDSVYLSSLLCWILGLSHSYFIAFLQKEMQKVLFKHRNISIRIINNPSINQNKAEIKKITKNKLKKKKKYWI